MKHRAITDRAQIDEIIQKSVACHIAMATPDGKPYLVTMNFGYQDGVLYLHSSANGKKIEILKSNPSVCIGFSTDYELRYQNENVACSWSMKYRSVLLYGTVEFVTGEEEKKNIIDKVMAHYATQKLQYNTPSLREVCCWIVKPEKIECRVYGY